VTFCLLCADVRPGISFGPDALVIPLQRGGPAAERTARSKLGPYYEKGPRGEGSLFAFGNGTGNSPSSSGRGGATVELEELVVLVGKYGPDEDVPYSGGVLDMTSG